MEIMTDHENVRSNWRSHYLSIVLNKANLQSLLALFSPNVGYLVQFVF